MRKIIYYILLDKKENQKIAINNDEINIIVIKGDRDYISSGILGNRANIVYLDSRFNTNEYQDLIKCCIKPICTLFPNEGIIFI